MMREGLAQLINETDLMVCGEANRKEGLTIGSSSPIYARGVFWLPDKNGLEVIKDARRCIPMWLCW
jgi:hypothetical protein